jgi:hypothetical protein
MHKYSIPAILQGKAIVTIFHKWGDRGQTDKVTCLRACISTLIRLKHKPERGQKSAFPWGRPGFKMARGRQRSRNPDCFLELESIRGMKAVWNNL